MSDQKIKQAADKAPTGLIPIKALIGPSRVFGYGAKKYAAGNFHTANLADGAGGRYIGAALRHLAEMQEPNGLHTPESLAAIDDESGLPHIDHVICGMLMLRAIMAKSGAIAVDPGIGKEPAPKAFDEKNQSTMPRPPAKTYRPTIAAPVRPLAETFATEFADAFDKVAGSGDESNGIPTNLDREVTTPYQKRRELAL